MRELTPPDSHYLNAAAGWRELGNYSEARFELERILNRDHPAVLEERWRIFAAEQQWLPALEIARRPIEVAPDDPSGWIHQSYSLHELKRTQEARDPLLAGGGKISPAGHASFNMSCFTRPIREKADEIHR